MTHGVVLLDNFPQIKRKKAFGQFDYIANKARKLLSYTNSPKASNSHHRRISPEVDLHKKLKEIDMLLVYQFHLEFSNTLLNRFEKIWLTLLLLPFNFHVNSI
jgi:hypothetical protein